MKKITKLLDEIHKKFSTDKITTVDVGFRWGMQDYWQIYPKKHLRIIGFEADEKECKLLESLKYEHEITIFPYALSNDETKQKLYITHEPGRSSLYDPKLENINRYYQSSGFMVTQTIEVNTTTLLKVFKQNNISPDFIKLDVQGSELNIIKGAGKYIDEMVGAELEVEFLELYKNQPLFSDVDQFMRTSGFQLYDLNRYWAKQCNIGKQHSTRGQLIFANAIYFREITSFYEQYTGDNDLLLKKLIMIINTFIIYGNFDSALQYAEHENSPLHSADKIWLRNNIELVSKIPTIQKLLFNNRISTKAGRLFHAIGNMLSYPSKVYGWGTDYNELNDRYNYHSNTKIIKIFGRK